MFVLCRASALSQDPEDAVMRKRVDLKMQEKDELVKQLAALRSTEAKLREDVDQRRQKVTSLVSKLGEIANTIKPVAQA